MTNDPGRIRGIGLVMPDDPADRLVRRRTAVRVIMVDPAGRILLFRDSDPLLPDYRWWVTPGGGIDPGETELQAAVRELAEETGAVVAETDLVGPLARRRVIHGFSDEVLDQDETFYLARLDAFDVDISGHTEEEQLTLQENRWWTAEELTRTEEWIWPRQLLELLRHAETDSAPLELGEVRDESTRPV